jgi:hypothetical protein
MLTTHLSYREVYNVLGFTPSSPSLHIIYVVLKNGNFRSASNTDEDEDQHCTAHHGDQPCAVRPLLLGAVLSVEC